MKPRSGIVIIAALIVGVLLCVHVQSGNPVTRYVVACIGSSILYLWFARRVLTAEVSPKTLVAIIVASLLLRLSFVAMSPIGSDDVYRYIWDGRVQAHGINPYRFAPNAEELRALHSETLPAKVNHPDMKSVYFPVAQWLFLAGYHLSGERVWGYKLLLFVAEALTLIGLFFLTRSEKRPSHMILLYALCPLPIVSFSIDAHLDGFGIPFLVFALVCYLRGRFLFSLLLFGLSISVKPVAVILLPILSFREKGFVRKGATLTLPAIILLAGVLPYTGDGHVL